MNPADSVIDALLAATTAQPNDVDLRRHLSELLCGAARFDEAFEHAAHGLGLRPDDRRLLQLAVESGRSVGRDVAGYERVLAALDGARHLLDPPDPNDRVPGDASAGPVPPIAWGEMPRSVDELVESWAGSDAPPEPDVGSISRPGTTLADVGGMDAVKARLERSFLAPLRNPSLQVAFGRAAGGGLVLWGPPGCGKTFIARALAGELGASFYEIALSDILDMWIGASERNLAAVFELARRTAPCVLFFDELDALGQKRSHLGAGGAAMRGVVNQLLAELDGATSQNDGVFFLGATNHPWDLDPALVRPGRFDRKILVLPPDREARQRIFAVHLRDRPQEPRLDLDRLAKATDGCSGADIRLICDDAAEAALDASIRSGTVVAISQSMLDASAASVRPSIGPWLEVARNYATYANESGELDDLVAYLKRRR